MFKGKRWSLYLPRGSFLGWRYDERDKGLENKSTEFNAKHTGITQTCIRKAISLFWYYMMDKFLSVTSHPPSYTQYNVAIFGLLKSISIKSVKWFYKNILDQSLQKCCGWTCSKTLFALNNNLQWKTGEIVDSYIHYQSVNTITRKLQTYIPKDQR